MIKLNEALTLGVSALSLYMVYKLFGMGKAAYNSVDKAVDSVVDPLSNAFFESIQGDGVELSPFHIKRLHRDYFYDDWQMKAEPMALFTKHYPNDMRPLLTADGFLKQEYRLNISYD